MLQRLRQVLSTQAKVAYIDFQAHPDREGFLQHLLSQSATSRSFARPSLVENAEEVLRTFLTNEFSGAFGVLLLDEVDELFASDSQADRYPHVLSRALRALAQSSLMSIVVTGERALFELTRDPSSPHWNFCTPIRLGPLTLAAGRGLLSQPLTALGISLLEAALDLAAEYTALHPNLLQYLGEKIVQEVGPAASGGQTLQVSSAHIQDIVHSMDYRARFTTTFWSQSNSLEKFLSTQLSWSHGQTVETLQRRLIEQGHPAELSRVQRGLEFLELYSIARSHGDSYTFNTKVFEQYFTPLGSTALVHEWLEAVE
jgi:hypothetical protein